MKEDLLPYYEHELSLFRSMGKEFAKSYGKIAQRLLLEPDRESQDPHVERLIEAFAFLAGRVHHKIDDEFPKVTESLLSILYPHYLQPIPSMSIAQFSMDPDQAQLSNGYEIKRNAQLYSKPIAGKDTTCSFRTCYPVTLWPLAVRSANVTPSSNQALSAAPSDSVAVIKIELKCLGPSRFDSLPLARLRFYLNGDASTVHTLYELLFNNVVRVELAPASRSKQAARPMPAGCIEPVGFRRDEGLLPYPDRSFLGYRLLQEYFSFPQKFLFFDVAGLDQVDTAGLGDGVQILIHIGSFERKELLQSLEQRVNADTFQLGCTPIVNLFDRLAEPIRVTQKDTAYLVVADIHRRSSTEVYTVDKVTSTAPYFEKPREYVPFYSIRHSYSEDPAQGYWYADRRTSERAGDRGTDVYLSLVNLQFEGVRPPDESLTVHVTCTNRDLAGELPFTGAYGELSLETGSMVRIRSLMIPSKTVRAPLRRGLQWRLISHLALNHLSIVQGGKEALQEILKLYDFTEDPVVRKQITGIVEVSSAPHVARIIANHGVAFVQGILVNIEFDEAEFVGSSVFLFASVLEAFLGLYSSINSFSQLVARSKQRKGYLKQWQPRTGEQILL
jgi:type VI secretion system protein ImpG